ncbi:MAG: winged helix-turn-helix domain-containing protein [Acidobacteriota bacterium]
MHSEFHIGDWRIRPSLNAVEGRGETRKLGSKAMDALVLLARRGGEVVARDDLVAEVWGGAAVSDEAVATVIWELRRALGDDARRPSYVATVRGRGYRLVAAVEANPLEGSKAEGPRAEATGAATSEQDQPQPAGGPRGDTAGADQDAPLPRRPISAGAVSREATPAPPLPGTQAKDTEPAAAERRPRPSAGLVLGVAATLLLLGGVALQRGSPETQAGGPEVRAEAPESPAETENEAARTEVSRLVQVLAVQPLDVVLSPQDSGSADFAAGLGDMLRVDLALSGAFEVIDVERAGGPALPLDADAVLEGSVQLSSGRAWVTVQLVDLSTGRLLWGGNFDRPLGDDPPATRRRMALEIARQIRTRLGVPISTP